VLSVEDWAEIRRLHRAEGLPIKVIAQTLKRSRNTVRNALADEDQPKYVRKPIGAAADAFEDAIRAELKQVPTMPATVIAEQSLVAGRGRGVPATTPGRCWSMCGR
jgi:transposase